MTTCVTDKCVKYAMILFSVQPEVRLVLLTGINDSTRISVVPKFSNSLQCDEFNMKS